MFSRSLNPILKKNETEQLIQMLQSSVGVEIYGGNKRIHVAFILRIFPKGIFLVRIPSVVQYFFSILKSTSRRPSRTWTMASPSSFKAFTFRHSILLVNASIITKKLSCSCVI